jgi:hypothetical protein
MRPSIIALLLLLASTIVGSAQTPPNFYYNCTGNYVLDPSGSKWVCVTIPTFQSTVTPGQSGTTCPPTSGVVGCSVESIGGRTSYVPYY